MSALVPLYGFVEGDTMGLLILAHREDTIGELAIKLTSAASVRVNPAPGGRVLFRGQPLAPEMTLAHAGIEAQDRVDLVWERE